MPRALEPGMKIPYVLEYDRDKPEGQQPTFYFRAFSVREHTRMSEQLDKRDTEKASDYIKAEMDVLFSTLVGWDNMYDPKTGEAIPFARENFDDIVTSPEAGELLGAALKSQYLSVEDKKKLESPDSSAPDSSVNGAQANATIPQPLASLP